MRRIVDRRAFLALLGAGTATGLLAACGGQAPAPKPEAKAPAPTAAPAAAPTAAAAPGAAPTVAPAVKAAVAPAGKKDLVVAQGADITTLDPHLSTFGNDLNATYAIFDLLTFRDASNSLSPQLATEWKATSDTQWTFKLRPNVKFHNADPFTSADVKFSIERTYDPDTKSTVAPNFGTVATIDAPDELTVVFNTKQSDPLLPARLAAYGGQMMPRKYYEQVGKEGFAAKPVGCGPYKYVEWVKDDRLVLEANKEYWGGAPAAERLTFKPLPEPATRIASLLAGESDIALNIPPDQIDQVNRSGKAHVEPALFAGLHALLANSKVPPMTNKLVKQALSLAIDRDAIIKSIARGQGKVPNGMIPEGDFAYDPSLAPLQYDPDKAKALLAEAGYNGEEIILESTQGYLLNDRQMSEVIDQMWKKVGINSRMEVIEISVRAQKTREKSFKGLYWTDPASTVGDPDGMAWRLIGPGGSQDYWRDPEWDRLGEEARFSLDQELRKRNYTRMNEIFREHLPWIPILQPSLQYGVQNYVQFTPYPSGSMNFRRENLKLMTG